MIKYLLILILIILPVSVFAQECSSLDSACNPAGGEGGFSFEAFTAQGLRILFGFVGVITLIFFIYAGWLWMTAQGNVEAIKKARNIMIWTSLGLVVIFSSYAIVSYLLPLMKF